MARMQQETREEKLRKKREAERKRYLRLKHDPVGREKLRQKEIAQYLKKKEKNVVKPIKSLSERDQRRKRKQWKEYSQTYRNKKKRNKFENEALVQRMHEDTPPQSGAEEEPIVPGTPDNNRRLSASKRYARNRKKRSRENKKRNELIKKLKLRIQKYKQKYYRLKKIKTKTDPSTPTKRVEQIMKGDTTVVARKLLFAEVISDQLKNKYKNLTSRKEKQIFKNVLGGAMIEKYRVKHILTPIVRGSKLAGKNTESSITRYPEKKRNASSINNKIRLIRKFLEADCNSKLCPGRKDYISKNKITKQKRYLCDTMGNLHKKFLDNNPDTSVSYAFFCKHRPFWIVYRKVAARDTCGCTCCMNMAFIVQTLHRLDVIEVSSVSEVSNAFCCEQKKAIGLLRECPDCVEKKINYKPYEGAIIGHYFKWTSRKYTFFDKKSQKEKCITKTTKEKCFKSLTEIMAVFESTIIDFLKHKGRSLHQYVEISSKKVTLKPNELMLHMDFSENYSVKYAEETQAYHFGGSRQQITLHTVVTHFKSNDNHVKSKSFCTLSKSLRHDVSAIWAHLKPILSNISKHYNVDTVLFVSDSPATQYRNKTMFYLLACHLHILFPTIKGMSWNYLESGHGKGAPDGIGGVTKRTADRCVAEGKDVGSFETLLTILEQNVPNVTYFSINDTDFEQIDRLIDKKIIKPFIGTMRVHQVNLVNYTTGTLFFHSLSSFGVENPNYFIGRLDYLKEMKKKNIELVCASDSEDDVPLPILHRKIGQKIRYEDVYGSDEEVCPSTSVQGEKKNCRENVKSGTYVLIEYKTGRTSYRYAGIAKDNTDDDELKVMFLKVCKFQNRQAFRANTKDIAFVSYDQILTILPSAQISLHGNKQYYIFPSEVDVFEKV